MAEGSDEIAALRAQVAKQRDIILRMERARDSLRERLAEALGVREPDYARDTTYLLQSVRDAVELLGEYARALETIVAQAQPLILPNNGADLHAGREWAGRIANEALTGKKSS